MNAIETIIKKQYAKNHKTGTHKTSRVEYIEKRAFQIKKGVHAKNYEPWRIAG